MIITKLIKFFKKSDFESVSFFFINSSRLTLLTNYLQEYTWIKKQANIFKKQEQDNVLRFIIK